MIFLSSKVTIKTAIIIILTTALVITTASLLNQKQIARRAQLELAQAEASILLQNEAIKKLATNKAKSKAQLAKYRKEINDLFAKLNTQDTSTSTSTLDTCDAREKQLLSILATLRSELVRE